MLQNKREFKILFPTTREYQSSTNSLSKDDSIETDCLEARFTPESTQYASELLGKGLSAEKIVSNYDENNPNWANLISPGAPRKVPKTFGTSAAVPR